MAQIYSYRWRNRNPLDSATARRLLAYCILCLYTFFLINNYGEHKFANIMISEEKYVRKQSSPHL